MIWEVTKSSGYDLVGYKDSPSRTQVQRHYRRRVGRIRKGHHQRCGAGFAGAAGMSTEASIWRPSGSLTGRGIISDVEQTPHEPLVCRPRRQSGGPRVHLPRWVILGQHHAAKACCSASGFCPEEGLPLAETNSREGRGASAMTLNYHEHEYEHRHEHGNNATLRDEALEGGGWCYTLLAGCRYALTPSLLSTSTYQVHPSRVT
jgi:hypothetical protein